MPSFSQKYSPYILVAPLFIASYSDVEFNQLLPIHLAVSTIAGCAAPLFLTHTCAPTHPYLTLLIQRELSKSDEGEGVCWSDELDLAQASQTAISVIIFRYALFPNQSQPRSTLRSSTPSTQPLIRRSLIVVT